MATIGRPTQRQTYPWSKIEEDPGVLLLWRPRGEGGQIGIGSDELPEYSIEKLLQAAKARNSYKRTKRDQDAWVYHALLTPGPDPDEPDDYIWAYGHPPDQPCEGEECWAVKTRAEESA